MKIGCCLNMTTPGGKGMGIEHLPRISRSGLDYIEVSLMHYMALSKPDRARVLQSIRQEGLPCEACNNFIPPTIRLTGADVELGPALDYAIEALHAASELGARVVVFGSGPARKVPDGFPAEKAWDQLIFFAEGIRRTLDRLGIQIAVEHLNRTECNIINRYREAARFARDAGGGSIGALLDLYHVRMEGEGVECIREAGAVPVHVHAARLAGRAWPAEKDAFLDQALMELRSLGYSGRVSVEGFPSDLEQDCGASLRWMRSYS